MSFLFPLFLLGGAAVAIPIALHLLRREVAPEVPFSAVRLLRRSPLEQTRRRRLRDRLLLLARAAALLLLAAAFARPYVADAGSPAPLHVVAIDRSYSMGFPGHFERALSLARQAIDEAPAGRRVAVLAFDDRADVLAPPGSAGVASAALRDVRPGFGGTRYAPMIARAAELAEHGPATLVVVTDLQRAGWEGEDPAELPAEFTVQVRDAGAAASNVAVVDVRRDARTLVASIRNAGTEPVSGAARARVDGAVVSTAPYRIAPGSTIDVPFAFQPPPRGALAVEIDDAAGFGADDVRHVLLDPEERTRVLVAGDGDRSGFYAGRALAAAEGPPAFQVAAGTAASLGARPGEEAAPGAVVLLSTRGMDRRAREWLVSFVADGGGLLVAGAPQVDPSVLAAVMQWPDFAAAERGREPTAVAATDLRHPIFRPFGPLAANLGQIRFGNAWIVRGEGWDVVARFTDGSPALLERRHGRGHVLVFASDLDRQWNDFPLHPGFVPFLVESVRHVARAADGRRDFLVAQAPPGVPARPGVYAAGPSKRQISVNVDPREGTTGRMTIDAFTSMIRTRPASSPARAARRAEAAEARQNLWWYGVMMMLVVLAAESVAGRGR